MAILVSIGSNYLTTATNALEVSSDKAVHLRVCLDRDLWCVINSDRNALLYSSVSTRLVSKIVETIVSSTWVSYFFSPIYRYIVSTAFDISVYRMEWFGVLIDRIGWLYIYIYIYIVSYRFDISIYRFDISYRTIRYIGISHRMVRYMDISYRIVQFIDKSYQACSALHPSPWHPRVIVSFFVLTLKDSL